VVEIRRATRDDLDAIAKIQVDSSQAPTWEPLSYLDYDCRVALSGDRAVGCPPGTCDVVGFLVSRQVAPRQVKSGQTEHAEREILSLAVDRASRRRGIGRALVEAELAAASKGTTWFLEVRESNIAAISLYRAVGFTPAGRRPDYYHDPAEAAIVMRFFS
jgi:ribosomal protein S18 acetylase RimI-like enzyme